MNKKIKPLFEGLAVGIIFTSITVAFQIPWYMSAIIGVLATIGGIRNSIKMDAEKDAKNRVPTSDDKVDDSKIDGHK